MILSTIILTIISAFLYRWGGMGSEEFNEKFPSLPDFCHDKMARRIGCMLVATAWLLINIEVNLIALFISMCLMYGFLTTYHDYLNDGKEDWKCWLTTGVFYSLALIPLAIAGNIGWVGLGVRTVVLGLATMAVSEIYSSPDIEEYGRGGLFLATMPLILSYEL